MGGSSRTVADTVGDRRLAAAERGMAGRVERVLLALVSEREECRQTPDSGVMGGESGGRMVLRAGIVDQKLVKAFADGTVAVAVVEVG